MQRCAPSPTTLWGKEGRQAVADLRAAQARFKRWLEALEIGRQTESGVDNTQLESGDFGFPAGKGAAGIDAVNTVNTALQALVDDPIAALDNGG